MGIEYYNNITVVNENLNSNIIEKIETHLLKHKKLWFHISTEIKTVKFLKMTVHSNNNHVADEILKFIENNTFWFEVEFTTDSNFRGVVTGGTLYNEKMLIRNYKWSCPEMQHYHTLYSS